MKNASEERGREHTKDNNSARIMVSDPRIGYWLSFISKPHHIAINISGTLRREVMGQKSCVDLSLR